MKKLYLSLLLLCTSWLPMLGQNLSTGLDAAYNSVPVGGLDSWWTLSSSPYGPVPCFRVASYLPFWQATPILGTDAGWINATGTIFGNLPGIYVFERPFNIALGTVSFSTNFRVSWDDVLISLELVPPVGPIVPLTVVPTAPYQLSQLVSHVEIAPVPGPWRIRATVDFIDNVGAFILSGDITRCRQKLPPSLLPGLIAYYPFSGGSLADFSGNGYNLTNPTMVPTPTTDRAGYPKCAYQFYGGNVDFLTGPFPAGVLPAGAPWSVSLWYQPRSTTAGNYELLFGRAVPPPAWNCPDGMGELSVGLYDCRRPVMRTDMNSCWDASLVTLGCAGQITQYIANGWQHLAAVYDPAAGSYTLYRDGIVVNTISGPCGTMYNDIGDLFLGLGYEGDLDDVLFYNFPIPATQVYELMRLGSTCCSSPNGTPPPRERTRGDFQIYPNPNTGNFHMLLPDDIAEGQATLEIYDWRGNLQHSADMSLHLDADDPQVDLGDAPKGVYLLKLICKNKTYFSRFSKE
jgi:hypothetical protein